MDVCACAPVRVREVCVCVCDVLVLSRSRASLVGRALAPIKEGGRRPSATQDIHGEVLCEPVNTRRPHSGGGTGCLIERLACRVWVCRVWVVVVRGWRLRELGLVATISAGGVEPSVDHRDILHHCRQRERVCVCVCVCARARKVETGRVRARACRWASDASRLLCAPPEGRSASHAARLSHGRKAAEPFAGHL